MKGKFITFEGSEGCGKSTQSKLLAAHLQRKGFSVVYVREPGGTRISEKIRKILLDPENRLMSEACEMLLYMAARAQIVKEIVRPALLSGKIVICDRFLDSTLAYQGYGLGVDTGLIRQIGGFATAGLKPDLTIFLDLPVKKGLVHRKFTKDRIERRPLGYHVKVRNGYLKLIRLEPRRIKLVKVEKDLKNTQEKIRGLVDKYVI
ncbi:MAG: dTMP kinase [Candidatus Omnitrophica bacterium]|nr:dTMP kinase [Candidatus Omnitrophota bacterium]MDD5512199.1 dTMP kinase [Candidatus Omnitrophota bacterium]